MTIVKEAKEARLRLIRDNEVPPLPDDWTVERFRFLFRESKERNGDQPVGDMLSVSEYRGVVPKEYDHEEQRRTDEELQNYRVVRPGQLAVNTMWLNHLGLGVSEHLGHVSPAYAVYYISDRLDTRFAHHLLRSQYYLKIYLRYLYGIRPNSFQIKADDWNSIPVIVPPRVIQKAIADFLDRETARIDQLIEKKQRLVVRLDEWFSTQVQLEISGYTSHATQEKDTGVVWALSIPERWLILHLRRLFASAEYGISESLHDEGAIAVLRMGNIQDGEIVTDSLGYVEQVDQALTLRRGDLLFNRTNSRDLVGKVGIFSRDDGDQFSFASYLVRIRPSPLADSEYLNFLLNSKPVLEAARALAIPSISQSNLNPNRYGSIKVVVPPLDEQRTIVTRLASLRERKVRVRTQVSDTIYRLREFRSALITAAVTGQIDVTTWGKLEQTDQRLDQIEEAMRA